MPYSLIVGAFFRPPASLILSHLPVGAGLTLVPEPDNQYDSNAIAVFIEKALLPQEDTFLSALQSYGHDFDSLPENIHLGYIPRNRTQDFFPPCPAFSYLSPEGKSALRTGEENA